MNTKALHLFLTVAKAENITYASKLLHVSQPTVSRQLRELEKELGYSLFTRSSKGVSLSQAGAAFRDTAEAMMTLFRAAKEGAAVKERISGNIYIGEDKSCSLRISTELIHCFAKKYPQVSFRIDTESAETISERVNQGSLDMGFLLQTKITKKLESIKTPYIAKWGILVRSDNPLAGNSSISWESIRKHPLILPESQTVRLEFMRYLGEDPHIAATFGSSRNAVMLAEGGVGIAVCLSDTSYEKDRLVFLPLTPTRETPQLLIVKDENQLSAAASEFLRLLRMEWAT